MRGFFQQCNLLSHPPNLVCKATTNSKHKTSRVKVTIGCRVRFSTPAAVGDHPRGICTTDALHPSWLSTIPDVFLHFHDRLIRDFCPVLWACCRRLARSG